MRLFVVGVNGVDGWRHGRANDLHFFVSRWNFSNELFGVIKFVVKCVT